MVLSRQLSISRSFPSCNNHPQKDKHEKNHLVNSFPVHSLIYRSVPSLFSGLGGLCRDGQGTVTAERDGVCTLFQLPAPPPTHTHLIAKKRTSDPRTGNFFYKSPPNVRPSSLLPPPLSPAQPCLVLYQSPKLPHGEASLH